MRIPVPADKNEIAMRTAMAGEMFGMKLIHGMQEAAPKDLLLKAW